MNTLKSIFFIFSLTLVSAETPADSSAIIATSAPKIPNSPVLNEDGKALKFYDDLIKDKVVAINFVFSTCPTICPAIQVNFSHFKKSLQEAGHHEVQLISVTVDPETDTPARLKKWSENFATAGPWTYITGETRDIDLILKKLEVFTADINDHPSFILIGNDASGTWKRVGSLVPPKTLTNELAKLLKEKKS